MAHTPPSPPGVKRAAVLAYVRECAEVGRPPTIREIGRAVGITSTSVVNYHLRKLTEAGEIRRIPSISRGLVLTGAPVPVALGTDVVVVIDGREVVGAFAGLAA